MPEPPKTTKELPGTGGYSLDVFFGGDLLFLNESGLRPPPPPPPWLLVWWLGSVDVEEKREFAGT
jgi:hypothetical protein